MDTVECRGTFHIGGATYIAPGNKTLHTRPLRRCTLYCRQVWKTEDVYVHNGSCTHVEYMACRLPFIIERREYPTYSIFKMKGSFNAKAIHSMCMHRCAITYVQSPST